MAADMEVHMVANMRGDKVADEKKEEQRGQKKGIQFGERGIQKRKRRKDTQFGERVGHGGWLIGPKLSRPKAYPTCVS